MMLAEDIRYLVAEVKREEIPSRKQEFLNASVRLVLLMEQSLPILEKLDETGSK